MRFTLNDLLALVGRLDDAPGFDTPRERFRRFLFERVTDAAVLSSFVEEGQHSLGEQHRRAIQDALVVLGRFLGFETTFGSYERVAGALKFDGQWRSRHRVEITLDVRADQSPRAEIDQLTRSLAALPPASREGDVPRLGLCVVTPLHGDRARLEEALSADDPSNIRIVSVRSLLQLADAASAGRVRHEEIVKLLLSSRDIDLVVSLMDRAAPIREATARPSMPSEVVALPLAAAPAASSHWLVTIEPDEASTPEQFVSSVIRQRQLLGISETAAASSAHPRAGDWLCFSLHGKGIVGHAQVDSVADGPARLRGAHRFGAVLALSNVDIYETPLALGPDIRGDRRIDRESIESGAPLLAPVSSEEFAALTTRAPESRLRSVS